MPRFKKILSSALFAIPLLFGMIDQSFAVEFTVDDTTDAVDASTRDGKCRTASGTCTLRAAIQQANATAGTDTVRLGGSVHTLTLAGANKGVRFGDLNVTDDLDIIGTTGTIIEGTSGSWSDRIFNIRPLRPGTTITVTLEDLAITGGNVTGNGGAVWSQSASLTLTRVGVMRNAATLDGGGIYFEGNSATARLTLENSMIQGNEAAFAGGGLLFTSGSLSISGSVIGENTAGFDGGGIKAYKNAYDSAVSLEDSAVADNTAGTHDDGGGVYVRNATLTLTNVTLSGNAAGDDGGGLYYDDNSSTLNSALYNVTIAGNSCDSDANDHGEGGGIRNNGGLLTIHNTILAENDDASPTTLAPNCSGAVTASGAASNLTDDDSGCMLLPATGFTETADIGLDAFADWGGDTPAHALESGSPAIDAGDAGGCNDASGTALAADQRGDARPQDGDGDGTASCDIGAYEYVPCDDSAVTAYSYLMSFHSCDTDCGDPTNHTVRLAGSNDGDTWTLIDAFEGFQGSVADLGFWDGYLYVYTPSTVTKYNSCFAAVSTGSPSLSSATDTGGYVDPSLVNSGSDSVVFYLPGVIGGDPAGCTSYPCTKEIHSAEVDPDDPSQLTQISGNRAEIALSAGSASDPDIVPLSDGTYLLYVSSGQDTLVFTGSSLTDTFASPDGATPRKISDGLGGVPSAIQAPDGNVWLYVTTSSSGVEVIRKAVSADGVTALTSSDFATVVDSSISSDFTTSTYVSSPSILEWPAGSWSNRDDGE